MSLLYWFLERKADTRRLFPLCKSSQCSVPSSPCICSIVSKGNYLVQAFLCQNSGPAAMATLKSPQDTFYFSSNLRMWKNKMSTHTMNPSGWCVEGLGRLTRVTRHLCTYVHPLLSSTHWCLGTAHPVTLYRNFRHNAMDVSNKRKEACLFAFGAP